MANTREHIVKRAGVNWGIGRELYTAPFVWINSANCDIKEKNGRLQCFDRFSVQDIGYNEHREINRLVIINDKTRSVVFEYGTKGANNAAVDADKEIPAQRAKSAEKAVSDADSTTADEPVIAAPTCDRCNKIITGVVLPDGTTMTASQLIGKSKITYKGVYCYECMTVLNKRRKAVANGSD